MKAYLTLLATLFTALTVSAQTVRLDSGWEVSRDLDDWIPAPIPGCVLTAYVDAGREPDPRIGDNIRRISDEWYQHPFYYRLRLPDTLPAGPLTLRIEGVCHSADVWVDGHELGTIRGTFRRGEFQVTQPQEIVIRVLPCQHPDTVKRKTLVNPEWNGGKIGADSPTFLPTVGWDWMPTTPGRGMGVWGDVTLSPTPAISLSDPVVETTLTGEVPQTADTAAEVSMRATVRATNNTGETQTATLSGTIGEVAFKQVITLAANESRDVTFTPDEHTSLRSPHMRLWWPVDMGEPYLYDASFTVPGDTLRYKAGLRQVTYSEVATRLQIYVNGQRVCPMGGNWGFPELTLRYGRQEYMTAVDLHRRAHFNMIRNWVGQTASRHFYDACDSLGVLVWQDFWLANPYDGPVPDDNEMFMDNARDYVRRIRRHPCIALYCGRNEGYPPAVLDTALRQTVATLHPDMLYISNSANEGVSGHGPYCALAAEEYFKQQSGRLHSERGMPCVMEFESLSRCIPDERLWPQNDVWASHDYTLGGAQKGETFNTLIERYGHPTDARTFCEWAQWLCYDTHRAMFEGSNVNRQGLLMWMSHPAHPSMVWQTYDYWFDTPAAYFAIRKALEPIHIQYDPSKKEVQVVVKPSARVGESQSVSESERQKERCAQVTIALYSLDGTPISQEQRELTLTPDATLTVAPITPGSAPCLLRLTLTAEGSQSPLSENTYLLNPDPDAIASVPPTTVTADQTDGQVRLTNTGATTALMVRLSLRTPDNTPILPAHFSDNYFHLLPGETRTITFPTNGLVQVRHSNAGR